MQTVFKFKLLKNSWIFKIFKIEFCYRQNFENSIVHKPSLGSCEVPQKNVGPIGLAILTFIGFKQTNKQTYKQSVLKDFKKTTVINPGYQAIYASWAK